MQNEDNDFDALTVGVQVVNSEGVDIVQNTISHLADPVVGNGLGFGIRIEASEDVLVSECTVTEDSNMAAFGIGINASTDVDYCCNNLNVSNTAMGFSGVCEGTHLNLNNLGKTGDPANFGLDCFAGTILGQQVFNVPGTDLQRHRGNKFVASTYSLYGARHRATVLELQGSQFFVPNQLPPYYPPASGIAAVEPLSFFEANATLEEIQACEFNTECTSGQAPNSVINANDRNAARGTFSGTSYSEMLNWESAQYLWRKLDRNRNMLGQDIVIDSFYQANHTNSISKLFEVQQELVAFDTTVLRETKILSDSINSLFASDNLSELEQLQLRLEQVRQKIQGIFRNRINSSMRITLPPKN